ncbi:MAG: hypothetical protein P4M15_08670 [Alphaproteobacteria bacterium]|nr:hypothetical protein [Alphaproteobacteria bacterium]
MTDDEKSKLERFFKWHGQKANPGNQKPASGQSPASSDQNRPWTLADLKSLLAEPETRSILEFLLGQSSASLKGAQESGGGKKSEPPPKAKLARFL